MRQGGGRFFKMDLVRVGESESFLPELFRRPLNRAVEQAAQDQMNIKITEIPRHPVALRGRVQLDGQGKRALSRNFRGKGSRRAAQLHLRIRQHVALAFNMKFLMPSVQGFSSEAGAVHPPGGTHFPLQEPGLNHLQIAEIEHRIDIFQLGAGTGMVDLGLRQPQGSVSNIQMVQAVFFQAACQIHILKNQVARRRP